MHTARWLNIGGAALALGLLAAVLLVPSTSLAQSTSSTSTLERVRATGKLTLGYYTAARPLSYRNASGDADGYSVALCRDIAATVKADLNLPDLSVEYVPTDTDPIGALKEGRVDLLCGPLEPTLSRRAEVSFSIPIITGGTGVLMRKDGSTELRELLEGRKTQNRPLWRAAPQLSILNQRKFAVVAGSSSERWVKQRKEELGVTGVVTPVPDIQSGLQRVLRGDSDAFIADQTILLDLAQNDAAGKDVVVINRVFNNTRYVLAMQRGDEDFRLLVDKVLSRLYRTGQIDVIYEKYLGRSSDATREWFRRVAMPE